MQWKLKNLIDFLWDTIKTETYFDKNFTLSFSKDNATFIMFYIYKLFYIVFLCNLVILVY